MYERHAVYRHKHALLPIVITDKAVLNIKESVENTDGLPRNPKCKLNNVNTKKPKA